MRLGVLLAGISVGLPALGAQRALTQFRVEGAGLVVQGAPVPALNARDARRLTVTDESGRPARDIRVEPYVTDPAGRVRWVRIIAASNKTAGNYTLAVADEEPPRPRLDVDRTGDRMVVRSGDVRATFSGTNHVRVEWRSHVLMDGPVSFALYPDARSIINAGGRTTVLAPFEPAGLDLNVSESEAIVTLRGRCPKQKPYNHVPGNNELHAGYDIEARFHFDVLTPVIRYDWRLTNRAGHKGWLEHFVMKLPIAPGAEIRDSATSPQGLLGSWADLSASGSLLGVGAGFVEDFGEGFGMKLTPAGLLIGGVEVPPDGGVGGRTPAIRRQFHHGMSRTFTGWLHPGGSARALAHPGHLVFSAQYYSDLGILPERGDKVNAGEFDSLVARSSRWLLENQWRGTLWAGEWWREWDVGRRQGAEEASNGNSVLAPLYHYFRTGDQRFLASASLSAFYVYDVQQDKKKTGFGPMLHTRRHLLDELDWIHPRYQRVMGPILASYVLAATRERTEIIDTLRHFTAQIQSEDGIPYNWDERSGKRASTETGVDTGNMIEALVAAWEATSDSFFLERARGYARWTVGKWRNRTDDTFWNWNLTRYVMTGLLAICRAGREYPDRVPELKDFIQAASEIERHTVSHPELTSVPGTIGGGDLHYVFYHAWLGCELAQLTGDTKMLERLVPIVRREAARQQPDGTFPMELGALWSQYPSRVISYYDPKSVVAYLPVLGARLALLPKPVRGSAVRSGP
jgi:hypothetical protein